MKRETLIIISLYFTSGCLAGGHFYENERMDISKGQKSIECVAVVLANPIYWSYVYFKRG